MRWPKGPPHLALNPPCFLFVFAVLFLFVFFLFFSLLSFLFFYRQKTCFPPKKGHFLFIFSVSLSFSLAFFGPPPFLPFLFICLSLVLLFLPSFLFFIFSFWFLLFHFVVFVFLVSRCSFVFVFCLLSCVVLNHNISFIFALHLVFWLLLFFCSSCFAILLFFDFWKPVKNISEKMEIGKTAKMKNAQKTDILTKAVSTVVFTNSVFVSFLCFFQFCIFAENTIKIGVSAKKKTKKIKKLTKF